jgi:tripartite-type tricarboxylate transporter receptor subunit TctC
MKKKLYALLGTFLMSFALWSPAISKEIVEIVVPTPPGGAIDMTARSIAKSLADNGIENIVVYHPGANGDIALGKVLEKPNSSILVASSANFVFSNIVTNRENIYTRDLKLIGPSVSNAMAFYAPLDSNLKTFKDLISHAKIHELPCATSNSHGEIELKRINQQYGTKFTPVPYKGTGQLIPAVLGGHVPCAYDQIAPYAQLQEKVLFLATSGSSQYQKNIPLINTVLASYQFTTWYAVGIPKSSKLLENKKFIETISGWNLNQQLTAPLVERSFVVTPADPDLNIRAEKDTAYYRQLLK